MKELEFKCKIKESEINGFYKLYNFKKSANQVNIVGKPEFDLKYKLSVDDNEEGIEKINFSCISLKGIVKFKVYTEELTIEEVNEIKKLTKGKISEGEVSWEYSLDSTKESWDISNSVSFGKGGSFYIEFVEIDVDKKIIKIY